MRASLLPTLTFLATFVTIPAGAQVQDRPVPEASTCLITFTMSNSSDIEVAVSFAGAWEEGDPDRRIRFSEVLGRPIVYVPAQGASTYEWRSPFPCGSYWQYPLEVDAGDFVTYEKLVPEEGATSSARVDLGDLGEPLRRRGRLDLLGRSLGPRSLRYTRIGYRTLYALDWDRKDIELDVPLGEVEAARLRAPGTTTDLEYLGGEIWSAYAGSTISALELGESAWFRVHLPETLGERFTVLLDWNGPSASTLLFAPAPLSVKNRPMIPGFRDGDGHHFSVSTTGPGVGIAPDRGSGLDGQATFGLDTLLEKTFSGRVTLWFEVNGEEVDIYGLGSAVPILSSTSPVSIPRTDAIDFYYEAAGDEIKGFETPPERARIAGLRVINGTDVPDPPPAISLQGEWQMVWNGRDEEGAFFAGDRWTDSALDPEGRIENGIRLRVSDGEGLVSRIAADTSSESAVWFRDPDLEVGFARWRAIQPTGEFTERLPGDSRLGFEDDGSVSVMGGAFAAFDGPDRIRVYRFTRIAPLDVWERVGSVADSDGAAADGSLQGAWVRRDSNNPRNDGMRIDLEGAEATLTFLPPAGSRRHQVGQIQWQDVTGPGTMRVRGSDRRYYDAQLTMEGPDRVHIDIDSNGPGNDQTWVRGGPSYDGEWVLARSTDGQNEGLRIQVAGNEGSARFLPPSAARSLRVGSTVWSGIDADGSLEAIGGSGNLVDATMSLVHEDVVRVRLVDGEIQLWARADALDGLPDGLLDDLAGGGAPDAEDRS